MKIGFFLKWNKNSLQRKQGNVIGDELYALSMIRELKKNPRVTEAQLYTFESVPSHKIDIMIYLNDTAPMKNLAKKHVLYLQNFYPEGSLKKLEALQTYGYDGYLFVSEELFSACAQKSLYLPFGVDTELFVPKEEKKEFIRDVAYIGNDIKGYERTMRYIYPACAFDFALYGQWALLPRKRYADPSKWKSLIRYQHLFSKISEGKIPQEWAPYVYSNSKVNLNCTGQDAVKNNVITLRTYEVLACKGFLITDVSADALSDCAVVTSGGKDLRQKIREYLQNEPERNRIAGNGYEYVRKNHTLAQRMRELFDFINDL